MTYPGERRTWPQVLVAAFLATGLFGCSSLPGSGAAPEPTTVAAEPNETPARPEPVTLALDFEPGTKTRYRVTTEAVTAVEGPEPGSRGNASAVLVPKGYESSEVVFTHEILGPVPGDVNAVAALVTLEQVRHARTSPGQSEPPFDSGGPADPNAPFDKLAGQTYTIEIHPLGYVTGIFNLLPVRQAVRGGTLTHAAALDLVSPPAIFLRHGSFTMPGPDVGPLPAGGRWRGVQQFTLKAPGAGMDRLGAHRFEKLYRLESVEQRPAGAVAVVSFVGTPIPKRMPDGRLAAIPFLSCSYAGGGEFNVDAGRVEAYVEHLEVRVPLPGPGLPPGQGPEGRTLVVTRFCRVQRLDPD